VTAAEIFNKFGAVHVSKIVPAELCNFFTHVLLRSAVLNTDFSDSQVPDALAKLDHEIMFDTLLERLWPIAEDVTGEELVPTYSFSRLYKNGNTLKVHSDRPACEISATIQLGRSHHYAWPIFMSGQRFDMAEGDAVFYKGCEIKHWREECLGPEGYYSGQVFVHYVRKNGPYAEDHFCDKTNRDPVKDMFVMNRTFVMDTK
jgi:hypothetical protein